MTVIMCRDAVGTVKMNELTINLQTKSGIPLYEQIYEYIKNDIRCGRMKSGDKLPSTRALSKHLDVSRSTVELAYEQLLSEGYVEAVPYRGYYIAEVEDLYRLDPMKTRETTVTGRKAKD